MVISVVEYEDCAVVEFDDGGKVVMTKNDIISL